VNGHISKAIRKKKPQRHLLETQGKQQDERHDEI